MATFEDYRDRWIEQNKSLNNKIDLVAAEVEVNKTDIECSAGAIEELAGMIGGDE